MPVFGFTRDCAWPNDPASSISDFLMPKACTTLSKAVGTHLCGSVGAPVQLYFRGLTVGLLLRGRRLARDPGVNPKAQRHQ